MADTRDKPSKLLPLFLLAAAAAAGERAKKERFISVSNKEYVCQRDWRDNNPNKIRRD